MKIVCGIFVIATIVSPIKNIMNFDGIDFDVYFRDDEFDYNVYKSKESFDKALLSQGTGPFIDDIKGNIHESFGVYADVSIRDDGMHIRLDGCDEVTKNKIAGYLGDRYPGKVVVEDGY